MPDWRQGLPLIVTSRVVLRELRHSDASALSALARSPEVSRFSPWPGPAGVDAFEAFVTRAWRERATGRYAGFAIVPSAQTEPAGLIELRSLQPKFYRAEAVPFLGPEVWHGGVFEDVMRLLFEFAFGTVGVQRIELRTPAAHDVCTGALERLGVQKEATLRSSFFSDSRFDDQYLWAVVRGLDALAGPP